LASQEVFVSVTLIVVHCNDLTVVFRMYKAAPVISALTKVYTIPCHDRGHVNVMVVLQSCTDSLHILQGSSSETFPASSAGACNISNIVVVDVDVMEEGFIAMNEEADIGIKQEEIPKHITFRDIKAEHDEVSYVCICLIRHILPLSRNVSCFCDISICGQLEQLHCWE